MELQVTSWFAGDYEEDADKVITLKFADTPKDIADVTIEDDAVVYTLSDYHSRDDWSWDNRQWMAVRSLAYHPVFVAAKKAGLRGTVRLWLNDNPRGPGLAASGPVGTALVPDARFLLTYGHYTERVNSYKPWTERKKIIFWRGSGTGRPLAPWYAQPRAAMCLWVKDNPNFDVAFSLGSEHQLPIFKKYGILQSKIENEKYAEYRHAIDIDGFSTSWAGLFTRLLFGCTVLKIASDQHQWYFDRLVPWVNYIPVGSIAELPEIAELVLTHEADCERIARAGQELAQSITWEAAINDGVAAISRELS